MPLLMPTLKTELSKFLDSKAPNFAGFPKDSTMAASCWAKAVNSYASGVTPPSTSAAGAMSSAQSLLAGMGAPNAATSLIPSALTTYASTLGAGMAPAFVAAPPPGPCPLAPTFASGNSKSAAQLVAEIASKIDTWFKTGTATPSVGGPPVPWA